MTCGATETGRLSPDFYRLWQASTVSQLGSALGAGALPLIAILVVHASALQVSLMAAIAGLASAAIALPMGSFIEFHRKRPIMMHADLVSFAALASVPLAACFGALTYGQLCVVLTLQTLCDMVFNAASGAYVKAIVAEPHRVRANSRFESTFWTAATIGAPIGGILLTVFGATITVALDAVSYLLSAFGIRSIAIIEPIPAHAPTDHQWRREIHSGWTYIFDHPVLRRLFWNGMLFGGAVTLTTPLLALLMLRELHFAPWQYGLALGLPCFGGLLGSLCSPRLVARFGQRAVLLGSGTLRTCWMGLLLIAGPSALGLLVILTAETLLLLRRSVQPGVRHLPNELHRRRSHESRPYRVVDQFEERPARVHRPGRSDSRRDEPTGGDRVRGRRPFRRLGPAALAADQDDGATRHRRNRSATDFRRGALAHEPARRKFADTTSLQRPRG
ncbi:MFS transporter [Nocardia violaceofusca]|uniref:MFS transporter n=1 Tax=Nocardia violaceofusca TaxID=941182 RepID=UPI0007C784BC|nr:MFS transporter [Nocardia violaceofusca]